MGPYDILLFITLHCSSRTIFHFQRNLVGPTFRSSRYAVPHVTLSITLRCPSRYAVHHVTLFLTLRSPETHQICLCWLSHNFQTSWRSNATASVSEIERCDHVLAGRLCSSEEADHRQHASMYPSGQKSKNDDMLLRQSESS